MSPRWGSPPLLVLVLCWLLARPVLGFPAGARAASRDLAESASGDDLISGSDFLSIFIGASLGPRSGRTRNLNIRNKVGDDPEQSISSFGARTVPRNRNTLQATDDETSSESTPRFEDLSDSNTPSVEFVSFDSENLDKNPLPDATSRIINIPNSGIEFQSESLASSSSRSHGPSGSDTSEYFSDTSSEESSTNSKTVFTTTQSTIAEIPSSLSDNNSELHAVTPSSSSDDDLNVVTDIVTSREELLSSTKATVENESQDASTQVHTVIEYNSSPHSVNEKEPEPSQGDPEDGQRSSSIPVTPSTSVSTAQLSTNPTEPTRVRVSVQPDMTSRTPSPPVQQVISVRVSSSVAQGPSVTPYLSRPKSSNQIDRGKTKHYRDDLAQTPEAPASEEDMQRKIDADTSVSTNQSTNVETSPAPIEASQSQIGSTSLVTEEQPAATAIQRSQFSVEEASPSSAEVTTRQQGPPSFQHRTVATVVETSRNPQINPVSYQTSVSSATSDSRVRFYSKPPSYHRGPSSVAETVQTSVVTSHRGSMQANYEQVSGEPISNSESVPIESRMGRYGEPHHEVRISGPSDHRGSFSPDPPPEQVASDAGRGQKSIPPARHQEPAERNYEVAEHSYGQPEQTYGAPEQNYEVDEAVSVMSHGRAHGLQTTTPSSADPNQKIAYVMDGRNYRKYRVEERTSDGFIVGEYGVVSHDDGSLRGVRYTADGTINPRLIQEALVKFLSL